MCRPSWSPRRRYHEKRDVGCGTWGVGKPVPAPTSHAPCPTPRLFSEVIFTPTAQQKKAVEAAMGAVLVVAGPGAGKTFCLIGRIVHLVSKLGIAADRVLAVTFTNKAA